MVCMAPPPYPVAPISGHRTVVSRDLATRLSSSQPHFCRLLSQPDVALIFRLLGARIAVPGPSPGSSQGAERSGGTCQQRHACQQGACLLCTADPCTSLRSFCKPPLLKQSYLYPVLCWSASGALCMQSRYFRPYLAPNTMHTATMPQAAPTSRGTQTYRQQRIAQPGQLPASLRFHQLVPPSAPAAMPPPAHPGASGHTISVDVRIGTSAARSIAFRSGLEQSYALGVGVPHNRSSVHSVITSLAALPASIPAAPTGKDSREEALKALPPLENVADDPSLHNPLARLERLGTGWFGVRSASPFLFACSPAVSVLPR